MSVNTAGLARDAGVARTTVAGYLDILQDTYLVTLLPAYEAKLRVKERKHPKLFWTDPGVVRAMKRQLHEPAAEERGALLEGIADLRGVKRRILVHMGDRPFKTSDGIEAKPVMHCAQEVLSSRL